MTNGFLFFSPPSYFFFVFFDFSCLPLASFGSFQQSAKHRRHTCDGLYSGPLRRAFNQRGFILTTEVNRECSQQYCPFSVRN